MFVRHPVDNPNVTQWWLVNKTGGITPDPNGTPMQQLVFNYGNYQPHGHDGWDYGCPIGTPVYAPGDGVIDFAGWGQDMPQHIALKYGFAYGPAGAASGIITCMDMGGGLGCYMAHKSESYMDARAGQRIKAGTLIGKSGNTGRSGGPHVHFSAIKFPVNYNDGLYSRVNPADYFTTVTNFPLTPGNKGSVPIAKEYEMSEADIAHIKRELGNIKSVLASPKGFTWDGKHYPSVWHVGAVTQQRVDALPERIWRETTVRRGGKDVPVLQDLADGTTYALAALDSEGLTVEDLAAIRGEMDEAVDAVKGTLNVKVSVAEKEGEAA